jgi:hypothetical protein
MASALSPLVVMYAQHFSEAASLLKEVEQSGARQPRDEPFARILKVRPFLCRDEGMRASAPSCALPILLCVLQLHAVSLGPCGGPVQHSGRHRPDALGAPRHSGALHVPPTHDGPSAAGDTHTHARTHTTSAVATLGVAYAEFLFCRLRARKGCPWLALRVSLRFPSEF